MNRFGSGGIQSFKLKRLRLRAAASEMPTHYQGSKRDRTALNAYINLVRASETVLSRMGADLAEKGLTLGQFGALEALLHLGPMCQRELSEKLLRSGGDVTLRDQQPRTEWLGATGPRERGPAQNSDPAHASAVEI